MEMAELYMFVSAACWGLLGVWWSKSSYLNLFLKILFFVLAVWGAAVAGHTAGFIVQIAV